MIIHVIRCDAIFGDFVFIGLKPHEKPGADLKYDYKVAWCHNEDGEKAIRCQLPTGETQVGVKNHLGMVTLTFDEKSIRRVFKKVRARIQDDLGESSLKLNFDTLCVYRIVNYQEVNEDIGPVYDEVDL